MARPVIIFLFALLVAVAGHSQTGGKPCDQYSFFGLTTGIWSPQGQNSVLGDHPFVGLSGGGWRNRFYYEFLMEFRFMNSANPYYVQYAGYTEQTDYYFGGYIGTQLGYEFLSNKNTSVYAMIGGGLDGFDMIEEDATHEYPASINVLNKNLGFGIQRYFSPGSFVGVEVSYNFIDYRNPGGTPMGGNAITFRLLVGGIRPVAKRH